MTLKASSNGSGLKKAPIAKDEFLSFALRTAGLQLNDSIVDLDTPSNIQILPKAQLGIWLDSWHSLVDGLGTMENALEGVESARDILFLASCRVENMFFSADATKPPLDQFGKGLRLLFESSTCYKSVVPVASYRGRTVYWGSQPEFKWDDATARAANIRYLRPTRAGGL